MTTSRPLRTDAARNAELLVRSAWRSFVESGPDTPLEEVAKRAGVGVATLYRRFPTKEDLLLAVLEWRYAEDIQPAFENALADSDAWRAMVIALEAALEVAVSARPVIQAARNPGALLDSIKLRYMAGLTGVVQRAQNAGVVRADVTEADIRMMLFMLISSVRMSTGQSIVWRRALGVLLDGLRPAAATPLPHGDPGPLPDPDPHACRG